MEPTLRTDPDFDALRRCRQGDATAFAEIVDRHKQGVFHMIYRWVGTSERSEELAQEVFLKAYREIPRFRGEAKFSTWLYQIALNLCRDEWRRRQRRPEVLREPESFAAESAVTPSAEGEMGAAQDAARLREALGSLPDIYREALTLRYFSDLSYEEMAAHSGEGLSNLKMRVARGLAQLKKKLEKLS